MPTIEQKVWNSLTKLMNYIQSEEFKGWDPYDALNSRTLSTLSFGNRWARIAYTQALKKLPINLRPILLIQKGYNPKGLGLFLSGYCKLFSMNGEQQYQDQIHHLVKLLKQSNSRGYSGYCWGYNFPWQSRNGFTSAYTPTIVNTSFVGRAFLEAYEVTGEEHYLDIARSTCEFILNDLPVVHQTENELCLSYNPFNEERIYNANILGAALLACISTHTGEKKLLSTAHKMANYVVNAQGFNGSWPYGEHKKQGWIDLHHTGFVLEGLFDFTIAAGKETLMPRIAKGLQFFRRVFFAEDGRPRLWHDRDQPTDIHAIEAIVTLTKLRRIEESYQLLEKIASWFMNHMQDEKGYFYYRRGRFITTKIPYMRWSQAWAFHALTTYLQYLREMG